MSGDYLEFRALLDRLRVNELKDLLRMVNERVSGAHRKKEMGIK